MNFSTDYVDTQRQALNFVSQNEFNINIQTEIVKSISGKSDREDGMFSTLSGTDSLLFSVLWNENSESEDKNLESKDENSESEYEILKKYCLYWMKL